MADQYSPERIARLAEILDEFEEIEDRDLEWFVGTIGIWKSDRLLFRPMNVPSYRRGYLFELSDDMRFVTVPFARTDGSAAVALLLRGAGEEFLAGWVRAEHSTVLERVATFLNAELDAARRYHSQVQDRDALSPLAPDAAKDERWLVFEQGSEEAPDAPWGYQQIRLSTAGRLEYEHRNRGQNRFVRGTVNVDRCRRLLHALQSTSFPAPPQSSFLPGGSVLSIATNASPSGRVLVDYFDGLKMSGYSDVIRELSGLNTAFRTSDSARLEDWGFSETR